MSPLTHAAPTCLFVSGVIVFDFRDFGRDFVSGNLSNYAADTWRGLSYRDWLA